MAFRFCFLWQNRRAVLLFLSFGSEGSADAPSEFLAANSVSSPLRDPTASPEVGPAWLADDFTATTEVEARRRRRLLPCGWLALAARLPALLV
jgi:hypothetical protein